jgi:hypothetical protein
MVGTRPTQERSQTWQRFGNSSSTGHHGGLLDHSATPSLLGLTVADELTGMADSRLGPTQRALSVGGWGTRRPHWSTSLAQDGGDVNLGIIEVVSGLWRCAPVDSGALACEMGPVAFGCSSSDNGGHTHTSRCVCGPVDVSERRPSVVLHDSLAHEKVVAECVLLGG